MSSGRPKKCQAYATERREATGIYDQQSLARTFTSSVSQSGVSVQTFPPNATWVYICICIKSETERKAFAAHRLLLRVAKGGRAWGEREKGR